MGRGGGEKENSFLYYPRQFGHFIREIYTWFEGNQGTQFFKNHIRNLSQARDFDYFLSVKQPQLLIF